MLTYAIMLEQLIVTYVQFMTVLTITECGKSGTKLSVLQDYHSSIGMNHTKNYGCESNTLLLHYK